MKDKTTKKAAAKKAKEEAREKLAKGGLDYGALAGLRKAAFTGGRRGATPFA